MNELIKFKNRKLKHKYNKISNKDVKNELLISEIMYEMLEKKMSVEYVLKKKLLIILLYGLVDVKELVNLFMQVV